MPEMHLIYSGVTQELHGQFMQELYMDNLYMDNYTGVTWTIYKKEKKNIKV